VSKGHETVKIFYADANARFNQNRGFDGRTTRDQQLSTHNSTVQTGQDFWLIIVKKVFNSVPSNEISE